MTEAEELYRAKLVDWMISQDIATGTGGLSFDDLLKVIATYIASLRKHGENQEE